MQETDLGVADSAHRWARFSAEPNTGMTAIWQRLPTRFVAPLTVTRLTAQLAALVVFTLPVTRHCTRHARITARPVASRMRTSGEKKLKE